MKLNGLNKAKVQALLTDLESEKIERTTSTKDTDKFAQAVCAFSNDLSNSHKNGYLLIGVHDDGSLNGLKADDSLLKTLGGLRSDGNILPQPIMFVSSFSFADGDVIAIEVQPSPFPPVRYKGKTWIRVGPRKAVANDMEERILIEKRTSNVSTFDVRPAIGNGISSIHTDIFEKDYLSLAVDPDILSNDTRDIPEKLASLRFFSPNYNLVTNAGLILFGKNVEHNLPGAYIQYVKFDGLTQADDILREKKFSDNLVTILNELDSFLDFAIISQRPKAVSTLKEKNIFNFPRWAIRELLMNAIMHRDYESNAPIKFYQFADRIEISNPGGLYGTARPENFPDVNDYRNPIIAEAMKVLGYVNRFNRGIARVQKELVENGNPLAVFDYNKPGSFSVKVIDNFYSEHSEKGSEKTREKIREKTREKIIRLLKENSQITTAELATLTEITEKGIEYHIKKLKDDGILERVGPDKGGHWKIIENK